MILRNLQNSSRSILLKQFNDKQTEAIKSFSADCASELDGFKVDVTSNKDGSCSVVCNNMITELPLVTILGLPYKLVNVEVTDDHSWRHALAATEAVRALSRVLFSSTNHSSILQLWSSCHKANCGLRWEDDEASSLDHEELANLPVQLMIHVSYETVKARPCFWQFYKARLVVWGIAPTMVDAIEFKPAILIVD
jgi:hypothetical protein